MSRKRKKSPPSGTQRNSAKTIQANQNNYYQQTNQFTHTPYQELDLEAINNERVFFMRFYFKKNLSERTAVIAFQRLHDLTSMQISLLNLTGNLRHENNQFIIAQNKMTYRIAQSVFMFWLLLFAVVMISMAFKQHVANLQFWKMYLVFATILLTTGYIFIYPCQLAIKLAKDKKVV